MINVIIHTSQGEYFSFDDTEYIEHHGIKGQKWGVRRYQNEDGSLTSAGKKRISKKYKKAQAKGDKQLASNYNDLYVDAYNKTVNYMNSNRLDAFNAEQKRNMGKILQKETGMNQIMKKKLMNCSTKILRKIFLNLSIIMQIIRKQKVLLSNIIC